MENKRKTGFRKETAAAEYLTAQGLKIIERNFYFPGGELDLIAKDGEWLCFIEVKYRTSDRFGTPEEAVTAAKQKKLILGARQYLCRRRIPADTPCRFDVVSILGEKITWIPDAFGQ